MRAEGRLFVEISREKTGAWQTRQNTNDGETQELVLMSEKRKENAWETRNG